MAWIDAEDGVSIIFDVATQGLVRHKASRAVTFIKAQARVKWRKAGLRGGVVRVN